MRILGDSNITKATIEASNSISFAGPDKLKSSVLADKMKITAGNTNIDLDFGSDCPSVDCIALCGTNVSESATMVLSYSDTDITIPELSITLPTFSNFNQIWFLDTAICKRFWRISISDPDPQDATGIEAGFLYIGEYLQFPSVGFPSTPAVNIQALNKLSATNQLYGQKVYNADSFDFIALADTKATTAKILNLLREKQTVDPVVIIPYENIVGDELYPPRFVSFTNNSYPYPVDGSGRGYAINISTIERF